MSKICEEKKKEKKNYVGERACAYVVGKKKGIKLINFNLFVK